MNIVRILVSFVAGTIVVLAMLVAGLQLYSGRPSAPIPVADDFTVDYLTPEQAGRLLRQGVPEKQPGSLQTEDRLPDNRQQAQDQENDK